MIETEIEALISDEKRGEKISFRLPKKLVDRILQLSRKKYAGLPKHGQRSRGFVYCAARGLLEWERENISVAANTGKSGSAVDEDQGMPESVRILKRLKQAEEKGNPSPGKS